MKRNAVLTFFGLTLIAALLAACAGLPTAAGTPIVSHGGPVVDYVSLVDALRAAGAKVDPAGQITQPFFTPTGQAIKVNGGDVQVFEYPDKASADAEAAKVAPDGGSIGTSTVSWVDAPHFYKIGKIILLYVGSDASIIGALVKAVGPQFAGR